MRYLELPIDCKPISVYITCVRSINDISKKDKYYRLICSYARIIVLYEKFGQDGKLYRFPSHTGMLARSPQYSVSGVTTDNLKKLYKNQMLNNKEPRKIYDKIMGFSKLSKCPFCGINQVSTLDHYLPKSEFPTFSVLPYNLIPCCKDCNHGKSTAYADSEEEQTLHPYYDNFDDDQWLFADVIEEPFSPIKYKAIPPNTLDDIEKKRIKKHFEEFELGKRFSIETTSELAVLRNRFTRSVLSPTKIRKYLKELEVDHRENYVNSWQTALYQALSDSEWYCNGGYNLN